MEETPLVQEKAQVALEVPEIAQSAPMETEPQAPVVATTSKSSTIPEQNVLDERFNKTLLERTRLKFKTPEEVWSGYPPDYSRLKVFGCPVYAHIRQDKLKPRSIKCIFLGYPEGVKAYRLWCLEPGMKKCIISRDVTFKKTVMANLVDKTNVQDKHQQAKNMNRVQLEVESTEITEKESDEFQHYNQDLNEEGEDQSDEDNDGLKNHYLIRDREKRTGKAPMRYGYADIMSFTFSITEDVEVPLMGLEVANTMVYTTKCLNSTTSNGTVDENTETKAVTEDVTDEIKNGHDHHEIQSHIYDHDCFDHQVMRINYLRGKEVDGAG
ncbi:hypothetical protein BUALT_Bualt02G0084500 [Buddleja alternifolia]|uniref:Retroviral polymerase SH3-like domain-containing protein n=1 Tax=Buddleja alternifolia TaxID=168488 RepID=A0AAV6Y4V4_9LAMI|nr:hypothetical protein BUALT_Bualt02G0084500 [Buddleja alternifolia]